MKVTVITPVKNGDSYLLDCLRSVTNQEYENLEHIVIDGNSTDDTLKILETWHSDRMKWVSRADRSMYDAINYGVTLSSGEIIGFLNSDDFYIDHRVISDVVKAFSSGADGIFGEIVRCEKCPDGFRYARVRLNNICYQELLLSTHSTFLPQPAFFIKRSLFDALGGFSDQYKYASDYDFNLRALKLGKIKHLSRAITVFRRHPFSITASGLIAPERIRVLESHRYSEYRLLTRIAVYGWLWTSYKLRNWAKAKAD